MTAISGRPAYSGPPLQPGTVDPPVEYIQIVSLEQAKSIGEHFAALGYHRIGVSMFETNWPAPHRDNAAKTGRKLGADLVLYAVIPVGTRLQSVPHITYEPGESYSGTTSGVIGGGFRVIPNLRLFTGQLPHAIHDRRDWTLHAYRRLPDQKVITQSTGRALLLRQDETRLVRGTRSI